MFSFVEYLIELEQNISFDPENDSAADLVAKAKTSYKMASNSPERALRARQQAIAAKEKQQRAMPDDPLANERMQITKMEDRLTRMKMTLARKESAMEQRGK